MVDVTSNNAHTKGNGRNDCCFRSGIKPFDIGCGVALRIPQALSLGQRSGVSPSFISHLGEDVVRGAVDDSHHSRDVLAH